MSYYTETCLYLIIQAMPFLMGSIRWRQLDRSSKIMVSVSGIGLLSEVIGTYFALRHSNNLPVYNIASLIIVNALTIYFCENLGLKRRRDLLLAFISVNTLLWFFSVFIFNSIFKENVFYTNYEIFIFIPLSVRFIESMISIPNGTPLYLNPHFYFVVLLLVYWGTNFIQLNLYEYLDTAHPALMPLINALMFSSSIFPNIGLFIVFLIYPKMKYAKAG